MKKIIITLMVIAAAVGIFAIAVDYGTQNDPLVSLSYITDVFAPDMLKKAESTAKSTANQVNSNVSSYESRVDKKVNEFTDRNTAAVDDSMVDEIVSKVEKPSAKQSAPFATIELTAGKSVTLTKGCEVLVRSGSVSCKTGNLVDATTGAAVTAGGTVSANHLYIAADSTTLSVKANSTVLIKGQYSAY